MVPLDVQSLIGRKEIWRSLRTDSERIALRRLASVISAIEADIETARQSAGQAFDAQLVFARSRPSSDDLKSGSSTVSRYPFEIALTQVDAITLGEAYERYIGDPTKSWSPSTREAYETCRKLVTSVIGSDIAVADIGRSHCRELLDVLRHLPSQATKRFPRLSPREACELAKQRDDVPLISAANANTLMSNFSSFLNWAVNEEFLVRNPARGLRIPDPIAKRDKRLPFTKSQLRKIFDAPLYRGCVDGERGYNKTGLEKPRNARFWVPLIALYSGARLGEICQLDASDIREMDGVHYMAITQNSLVGSDDKSLKTSSSERSIPLHPMLVTLGLPAYARQKDRSGSKKLFDDIKAGSTGSRATAFSKWFTHFLRACGASKPRSSFHSFRHNFRDELRAAEISHEIAMLLGGWTTGGSGRQSVSGNYGSGFKLDVLNDAMMKLAFDEVNVCHLAQDAR